MGFASWFKEAPRLQKRAPRHPNPGVTVYYWDGGAPRARQLKDISLTGAYLYTNDRWYPGTIIKLVLQRGSEFPENNGTETIDENSLSVLCKVTRQGSDGVGVRFLLQTEADRERVDRFIQVAIKNRNSNNGTGKGFASEGQALVEYALMLPLLLLLIFNVVNFGGFLYAFITVADAARAGAQYAILGLVSVGSPTTPSASQIRSVIAADASALPSSISACVTHNPSITADGTCSFTIASVPADPEAPQYVSLAIDVKYAYTPLVNLPSFHGMLLTLPPTTIQRRVLMRCIQ